MYHKNVMPEVKSMLEYFKDNPDESNEIPDSMKKFVLNNGQCAKITKNELQLINNMLETKIKWDDLKKSKDDCNNCKSLIFSCTSDEECQSGQCVGEDGDKTCKPPQ